MRYAAHSVRSSKMPGDIFRTVCYSAYHISASLTRSVSSFEPFVWCTIVAGICSVRRGRQRKISATFFALRGSAYYTGFFDVRSVRISSHSISSPYSDPVFRPLRMATRPPRSFSYHFYFTLRVIPVSLTLHAMGSLFSRSSSTP